MAQYLIATYSLQTSYGGGFDAGDKIHTYWDDSTSAIVVKLDDNVDSFGGNISTYGNNGDYETDISLWTGPTTNLTRSSTQAHAGTYSARYQQPDATNKDIIFQQPSAVTAGKTYKVTAWVFSPSGSTIADNGSLIRLRLHNEDPNVYQIITGSDVTTTVGTAQDTWIQISVRFSVIKSSTILPTLKIVLGRTITINTGGFLYIDEFYIKEETGFTPSTSTITTGPDLGVLEESQISGYSSINFKYFYSAYQFCNGTTLTRFLGNLFNPAFPYVQTSLVADAPECATSIIVCDLHFISEPAIVQASDPYTADGEISVQAQSSRSAPKYSLSDVPYASMTNTTGVFTGLTIGVYTVYATDSSNCKANISVKVTAEVTNDPQPTDPIPTYTVKYRMEHDDVHNVVESRTDILERGFNGTVTEIDGSDMPFVRVMVSEEENNKFECLKFTRATLQLINKRDYQFIGLFSQDDRKFRVDHYKPVGTLLWSGFIVPSVFSERYTASSPYPTNISVTDGLKELENVDFTDKDGNKLSGLMTLIKIVALVLKKTGLRLQIRVACQILEDTHDSVNSIALEQTQEELSSFYELDGTPWNCARVLRRILQPFGAKIVQENGVWNVVRVEEQYAQYSYRQYNVDGVYASSGNYNPIKEIKTPSLRLDAIFKDQDHVLNIVPAYGKISIIRKLNVVPNLFDNGSFDIDRYVDGRIDAWTVDLRGGALFVVEKIVESFSITRSSSGSITPLKSGSYALKLYNFDVDAEVYAHHDSQPIEYTNSDSFELSFNYRINLDTRVRTSKNPLWVKIGWSLQVGSQYYSETLGDWTTDTNFRYNYIYVEEYNKDILFKLQETFRSVTSATVEPIVFTLYARGPEFNDFTSLTTLKAITTTTLAIDSTKIKGQMSISTFGGTTGTAYYVLISRTDTPDDLLIVRPDDYNATTNPVQWTLLGLYPSATTNIRSVLGIYFDEVAFNFFPFKEKPPEQETIETVINENFKENLEVEIESGDLPDATIDSKRYIYNNYFRDLTGIPTTLWTRNAVTEDLTIQKILAKSYANQYKYPTFKVTGSFLSLGSDINFLTTLKQTIDQPVFSMVNEEFTGNITGWTNVGASGTWAHNANKARSTPSASTDSAKLKQTTAISFQAGQRVSVEFSLERTASSGTRNDWFVIALLDSSNNILQSIVGAQMTANGTWIRTVKFTTGQDSANIAFYIRTISGTGTCTYDVDYFRLDGLSVVRYFTANYMEIDERNNSYRTELMQLVPVVLSSDPIIDDSGEGNTNTEGGAGSGSGGSGSSFTGAFSSAYGAGFDTQLN